jgi:hypothetical protein
MPIMAIKKLLLIALSILTVGMGKIFLDVSDLTHIGSTTPRSLRVPKILSKVSRISGNSEAAFA